MSKDFFERKTVKPADGDGFDPTNMDDDFVACGLDKKEFQVRYEGMFKDIELDIENENPVVTLTQAMVNGLSHRELAFLAAKEIANQVMEEVIAEQEKKKKK